jgi:type I restriction enzyme M protein
MNLYLHGIGGATSPVIQKDALLDRGTASDIILTNPPFGKRQSFRIVREYGGLDSERQDYVRDDFTVTTGNKQLNFLQHIMSILKVGGTAAVVARTSIFLRDSDCVPATPPSSFWQFPEPIRWHFLPI